MSEQPPSDLESIANQPVSADPIGDLPARFSRDRAPRVNPWVMLAALLIFGGIVAIGFLVYNRLNTTPASVTGSTGIVTYDKLSRGHSSLPQIYQQIPPVGGIHDPAWLNCGIYDQPVPNENAVHSLEHGVVWVTYQPELSANAIQKLRTLVKGHPFVILSPYPNLPKPVVASAWGVQLQLDDPSDARLQQFIIDYEQGPQNPEPGAPCTDGVGRPLKP